MNDTGFKSVSQKICKFGVNAIEQKQAILQT